MAKRKTQKTLAELEYAKELKRIKQFLRRATNRGYMWDDNIIPKKPKRITKKSVEKLKKLTPTTLYEKASYTNTDTGEMVGGLEGRHIERKKSAEKAHATRKAKTTEPKNKRKNKEQQDYTPPDTDYEEPYYPNFSTIVLENVRYMIDNFMPSANWTPSFRQKKEMDCSTLSNILNSAIADEGEGVVAERLNFAGAEELNHIVLSVLYDSDGERTAVNIMRFATILNGGPLNAMQALDLAEMSEAHEWWESPQ